MANVKNVFDVYTPASANDFLQKRLTSPSVVVSRLHPFMMGRLVEGFLRWDEKYPTVSLRILSGVRSFAQQVYLYNKYGSPRAANPNYNRGADFEKINVVGSLHQPKGRSGQQQYGWAVDFQKPSIGWKPVWDIFEPVGIKFVLRNLSGSAKEEWHATVRSMDGWFPGLFPTVPGEWRRIYLNDVGPDVAALQSQVGKLVVDEHFGPKTQARIITVQEEIGTGKDGNWGSTDQARFMKSEGASTPPSPPSPPSRPSQPSQPGAADDLIQSIRSDLERALVSVSKLS